jgi:hypothetical protein
MVARATSAVRSTRANVGLTKTTATAATLPGSIAEAQKHQGAKVKVVVGKTSVSLSIGNNVEVALHIHDDEAVAAVDDRGTGVFCLLPPVLESVSEEASNAPMRSRQLGLCPDDTRSWLTLSKLLLVTRSVTKRVYTIMPHLEDMRALAAMPTATRKMAGP